MCSDFVPVMSVLKDLEPKLYFFFNTLLFSTITSPRQLGKLNASCEKDFRNVFWKNEPNQDRHLKPMGTTDQAMELHTLLHHISNKMRKQ